MTTIYIDTNIVMNESFLRSSWSQSFLKACTLLQISVVIPEVVIDETKGNYPSHLRERAKSFQKAERELSKLIALQQQPLNVADLVEEYGGFLDELIEDHNVIIASYPKEITAKKLVEMSYQAKKPFKDGGEGHKDYIVWETIKSHIMRKLTSTPNIFVTNNVKDFCQPSEEGKFNLHPYLSEQIEEEILRPKIQVSLKNVLDETIMPLLEGMTLDDIPELNQQDIEHITNSALLEDLPQRTAFGFENVPFSNEVSISSVGEALIDHVSLAKADEQLVIRVSGTLEVEVGGFMEKFEIYHNEGETQFHVVDYDWNDHVAAVATSVEMEFELSVFYSVEEKKIIGHEIILPQETKDPWVYK